MTCKPYAKTLLFAGIALIALALPGNGPLLAMALPAWLAYLLVQAVRLLRRPAGRRASAIRLGLWSAALAVGAAFQTGWHLATRGAAEIAAEAVHAYHAQHGRYPARLADAGIDEARLRSAWSIRYQLRADLPSLAYPAAIMPLSQHDYDFSARRWRDNDY